MVLVLRLLVMVVVLKIGTDGAEDGDRGDDDIHLGLYLAVLGLPDLGHCEHAALHELRHLVLPNLQLVM